MLGRRFPARVSDVPPVFDPSSRTFRVRLLVDNPGTVLRPGMFVDVELPVRAEGVLAVPVDAVLDSGSRKTVFVDRGGGYFEPRTVETGRRFGEDVEVLEGLMAGEKIVVSGNFMVDSESRMKAALSGMTPARAKDPVCRMQVDEAGARAQGLFLELGGKAFYFCSAECKEAFSREPARYDRPASGARPAGDSRGGGDGATTPVGGGAGRHP